MNRWNSLPVDRMSGAIDWMRMDNRLDIRSRQEDIQVKASLR